MAADETHRYSAFISYSRTADAQLAPALENALERFAKPWNRLRALRVFRDDADLSTNPGLWSSITAALDDAEYFILLASPAAAESTWVGREIEYWRTHRDVNRLLLVVTEGELVWNEASGDFDWTRATAAPKALQGAFEEEPRYNDLRWARAGEGLTLDNDRFREAVADLAGTLHGRPKDEMIGEQVRQHRRTIRLARSAVAVLATLTFAAIIAATLAVRASDRAESEARTALSRQLAAESAISLRDGELDRALLLAAQAEEERGTVEASSALAAALTASGHLKGIRKEAPLERAAMSPDGRALALVRRNGPIVVRNVRNGRILGRLPPSSERPSLIALSSGGTKVAVATVGSSEITGPGGEQNGAKLLSAGLDVYDVKAERWDPHFGGRKTPAFGPEFGSLSISHDGNVVAWSSGRPGVSEVAVWRDGRTDTLRSSSFPCQVLANSDGSLLAAIALRGVKDAITEILVWQLSREGPRDTNPRVAIALPRALAPESCRPAGVVAFNPTQPEVLAIGGRNGAVSLWDVRTGRAIGAPLRTRFGPVSHLAFSPDGGRLIARDAGGISMWDLDRRMLLAGGLAEVAADAGAWFVDERTVVSVGSAGTVASSDLLGSPNKLARLVARRGGGLPPEARFSPDGSMLAVTNDKGAIRFLDAHSFRSSGEPIRTESDHPSFAFSSDGKRLVAEGTVTGSQAWQVWDVGQRRPLGAPVPGESGIPAFSLDGEPVVIETGLDNSEIKSLGSGTRIARLEGTQDTINVEFHAAAGQALVETLWGSGVWDARTGKRISRLFPSSIAAWTGDGKLVATGGEQIELWDAKSGRRLATLQSETAGRDLEFSPDGRLLVAVGDGLEVWDISQRSLLGGRRLGELSLAEVDVSPDGRTVATLDDAGNVFAWTLDRREWVSLACRLAGRRLTDAEWEELAGARTLSSAC